MKFRNNHVVIEAMQFTGDNYRQIESFVGACAYMAGGKLVIRTLKDGPSERHIANHNDWIIKGSKGEFYPVKDEIFRVTYEAAE